MYSEYPAVRAAGYLRRCETQYQQTHYTSTDYTISLRKVKLNNK